MRGKRRFNRSRHGRIGGRSLGAEPLEKRELLAADFTCVGVPVGPGPNDGPCQAEAAIVDADSPVAWTGRLGNMGRWGGAARGRAVGLVGPRQTGLVDADEVTVAEQLSEAEVEGIMQLRQEEKLARDVYLALAEQWDAPVFADIAQAESRHMAAVGQLIDDYDLEDPVQDDTPGEFTDPTFADLYTKLVNEGSESLIAAYKVGATIEDMDIKDLQDVSTDAMHADVQRVYTNLERGSRNHLRAFDAQIKAAGEEYEAQFLSQAEYDAIAASPVERGGGHGMRGQRGHAMRQGGQAGNVGRPAQRNGRFDQSETGRHVRDRSGDRNRLGDDQACDAPQQSRDRDRDRTPLIGQAVDTTDQQAAIRDRLLANWGSSRGGRWG